MTNPTEPTPTQREHQSKTKARSACASGSGLPGSMVSEIDECLNTVFVLRAQINNLDLRLQRLRQAMCEGRKAGR